MAAAGGRVEEFCERRLHPGACEEGVFLAGSSIVTHSGFEKIPVSRATQEKFIKAELGELGLSIEEQRKQDNRRIVKSLERAKKKLEGKLKELAANEKKDDGLTFEELGVDRLFVDEAHYFKNLFYLT